jgi:hypothetical protein
MNKWDEKKMSNSIDDYFDNITADQFDKDLEKTGCSDLVEDEEVE